MAAPETENRVLLDFAGAVGGPQGSSSEMAAADAQAALADAIVRSSLQLPDDAVRALMFLGEYLGPEQGAAFKRDLMALKPHQNPGSLKRFTEAIKAMSLSEFMRGVNLNLGGK